MLQKIHIYTKNAYELKTKLLTALTRFPNSEPLATIARNMSPVARWQAQNDSASFGACQKQNSNILISLRVAYW